MPLNIKKTVKQMVAEADSEIETIPLADVMAELERRTGQSGIREKAGRQK